MDEFLIYGQFHNGSELPPRDAKESDFSIDVLVDLDGRRKNFRVGFYH